MPKKIQVENQIIEFPDDMPDNEIEAVIKKEFYTQQPAVAPTPAPAMSEQPAQIAPMQPQNKIGQLEAFKDPSRMSQLEAFATTATNLPFMSKAKAITAALSAKAKGGDESIGQFYDEALSNELANLKQARQQYPKTAFAGQLLADVTAGGTVGKLLKLSGTTAKSALALGGITGGLTSAGETPDLQSQQGLYDALSGAGYGAVGGLAGQQVGKAIGKSVPAVRSVVERLKKSTPESVLAKTITPEEAGQQARKLSSRIEEGRITTLPELQDENILGLTRILAKTQGSNKIINNYINNKTASSAKRVGDLINKNVSAEGYFDTLDTTIARRKELTSPLYKQAEIEGQKNLDKMLKVKKVNVVKPLLDENGIQRRDPGTGAYLTQTVKENAPPKILYDNPNITKYVNMAKNEPLFVDPRLSNNSFVVLKGAKQMIDQDINAAINAGNFTTSGTLKAVKRQILDILEKASPTYKEANRIFAGESALKNAQEDGLKFNQYRNGEEVKRAFSQLTDGEKETFKIGVKDYLMDKVAKASDRNPAKTIFGSQLERDKLKAVFNNPKEFTNFTKRLNDEIRVFDVKQRIVGGSRTDFNLEEQGQLLDKVAKGALNFKTLGVGNVILTVTDAIKRRYYGLNEKTANQLAKIMIDPQKSVDILNKIVKNAKTAQEKTLIQKFTEDLSTRNFTSSPSATLGRAMVTEQQQTEGQNAF